MKSTVINALTCGLSCLLLSGCGSGGNSTTPMPAANMAPQATASNFAVTADTGYDGQLLGVDPEKDPLVFALASAPSKGTLSLMPNGKFHYEPTPELVGQDSFSFTVTDGKNTSSAAKVNLGINVLQADFSHYSRVALAQKASDTPAPLNTRELAQDVTEDTAYDDIFIEP